jgi:hypothetical protein
MTVDVNVGSNIKLCSLSLYWVFDIDTRLQYFQVYFVEGVGMVEFYGLDPERTYIIKMYIEDKFTISKRIIRSGYPNGMGKVTDEGY